MIKKRCLQIFSIIVLLLFQVWSNSFVLLPPKVPWKSSRVCHLCSCGHACGVSAVVHRLDKKQNKPEWSGEGWSQIKRFKASFASDYLMPIRGDRRWSSVRSSRCRRKSTSLSASGRISTVSHVKAPPHPPHATVEQTEKMSFSSSVNGDLLVVRCCCLRLCLKDKTLSLPSEAEALFHTAPVRQTDTVQVAPWSLSAQLTAASSQQTKGANHNPTCSVTTLLFPS